MSKPRAITPAEHNRELFADSQGFVEANLAKIAAEVIGVADVRIKVHARKDIDVVDVGESSVFINHQPENREETTAIFTYSREIGLDMPPSLVRLAQRWTTKDGIYHDIDDQIFIDEPTGALVRTRTRDMKRLGDRSSFRCIEETKPARPGTILAMARLAAYHAESNQQ